MSGIVQKNVPAGKSMRSTRCAAFSFKGKDRWWGGTSRRRFIKQAVWSFALSGALAIVPIGAGAIGESYPARAVTIVVPWTPGSSPDGISRVLGAKLANRLGQPFVVENRPGA